MRSSQWLAILALLASLLIISGSRGSEWDGIAFAQPTTEPGMRTWWVLPTRLIPDDAELPAETREHEFTLHLGRNESECAQLVIMRIEKVADVSVRIDAFDGDNGATLPSNNFKVNKVGQVPGRIASKANGALATWKTRPSDMPVSRATSDMYDPSAAMLVPDPLLRDTSFSLDAPITRIWITVHATKETKPGLYRGRVRLKRGQADLMSVPLAVRVWNQLLSDENGMTVMANVTPDRPPRGAGDTTAEPDRPLWDHLKPYYDDLKAHHVNAAGEVFPAPLWSRDLPPPDMADYEKALKYVLGDLGFVRFRFPAGGGAGDGEWDGINVFETPKPPSDGIWITGSEFTTSDPPDSHEAQAAPAPGVGRWVRIGGQGTPAGPGFGAARLDGYAGKGQPWVEYSFDNAFAAPLWVWLQVDGGQKGERKIVNIDGKDVGIVTGEQTLAEPTGFVMLPAPVRLSPGKHTLRVLVDNMIGSSDPVDAVFLCPQQQPDIERILRDRAPLTGAFKEAFAYHAQQTGDWLRQRGFLKKAQVRLLDDSSAGSIGRVGKLYDYVGDVLPSVRRELSTDPSLPLRKSAEVWTPSLTGPTFDPEAWLDAMQSGQELWASHPYLHTLGYPPIGMRLIPLLLARHQVQGYVFNNVNFWVEDPWKQTGQKQTFMRGTLIYPDPKTGGPVDSVRWELFREGIEDFQTLSMLRVAVDAAAGAKEQDPKLKLILESARKLLDEEAPALVKSARDFTWDAAALESVRVRAGEALSQLTAP